MDKDELHPEWIKGFKDGLAVAKDICKKDGYILKHPPVDLVMDRIEEDKEMEKHGGVLNWL